MPTATDELDRDPWPTWFKHTASAFAGAGVMLITGTLWLSSVKEDAKKGAALEPRVTILENHEAEDRNEAKNTKDLLNEVRGDVKEILRRIPR